MKYMTGNQIRNTWLRFFKNTRVMLVEEGASLIPNDDPTLIMDELRSCSFKKIF